MNEQTIKMYAVIETNFKDDYKNLLRMAERKLGNLWAEDCVMDTYEAVLKAAPRLHAQYDIKYLMRAALYNRIKDYMGDRIDAEEIDEEHIYGGEVEDKWRNLDSARKAISIIDRAIEPMRTALYLTLLEGVSMREVTKITGISTPTLSRAVGRLRAELEDA